MEIVPVITEKFDTLFSAVKHVENNFYSKPIILLRDTEDRSNLQWLLQVFDTLNFNIKNRGCKITGYKNLDDVLDKTTSKLDPLLDINDGALERALDLFNV